MYRQITNKDCAVTACAQLLSIPYTNVVNAIPDYRFTRARNRTHREQADQIIGRRKKLLARRPRTHGDADIDLVVGKLRFNSLYRTLRHPYFCSFGLHDRDYRVLFQMAGVRPVERQKCPIDILRRIPLALLALPSLNVRTSSHAVIWYGGRIYDPSPKRRYNFARLRQAEWIDVMAVAHNDQEYADIKLRLFADLQPVMGYQIVFKLFKEAIESTTPVSADQVDGALNAIRDSLGLPLPIKKTEHAWAPVTIEPAAPP